MIRFMTSRTHAATFAKGVIVGGLLVVAFAAGLGVGQQEGVPGVVRGTAFRLLDKKGETRGEWRMRDEGAEFVMFDAKGRTRAALRVQDSPIFKFWGENSEDAIQMYQSPEKGSVVLLSDTNGKGRIQLLARPNLTSATIRDKDGHIRIDALLDPRDLADLRVENADGEILWNTDPKQAPKKAAPAPAPDPSKLNLK